jgi:hypothetical protein
MGPRLVKGKFPQHEFGTLAFRGIHHWIQIRFLTSLHVAPRLTYARLQATSVQLIPSSLIAH